MYNFHVGTENKCCEFFGCLENLPSLEDKWEGCVWSETGLLACLIIWIPKFIFLPYRNWVCLWISMKMQKLNKTGPIPSINLHILTRYIEVVSSKTVLGELVVGPSFQTSSTKLTWFSTLPSGCSVLHLTALLNECIFKIMFCYKRANLLGPTRRFVDPLSG